MRKYFNFIVYKWNSLLSVLITLYISASYFQTESEFVGILALLFALIKFIGILVNHNVLRTVGLIGINVIWGVTAYYVSSHLSTPVAYPLFVLGIGFGISLQERFHNDE